MPRSIHPVAMSKRFITPVSLCDFTQSSSSVHVYIINADNVTHIGQRDDAEVGAKQRVLHVRNNCMSGCLGMGGMSIRVKPEGIQVFSVERESEYKHLYCEEVMDASL